MPPKRRWFAVVVPLEVLPLYWPRPGSNHKKRRDGKRNHPRKLSRLLASGSSRLQVPIFRVRVDRGLPRQAYEMAKAK